MSGCAFDKKPDPLADEGRLLKLGRANRVKEERVEDQKIRKLIRSEISGAKISIKREFQLPKIVTEETLYSEILNAYQSRQLDRMDFMCEKFIERFPRSVFADNALYLKGQLGLALGAPTEALRSFEMVLQRYPTGNKRASALFGKAVAYRKLQLYPYAEKVLDQVKKKFPGSPEYFKVDLERKLLQLEKES